MWYYNSMINVWILKKPFPGITLDWAGSGASDKRI